ncbi:MAG: adenylate/guanylate cyclase domain-containing protein, partial [SAR324 cluster bacterium]|nr:adenylate/guanylate cyclase domain-containing protein [SAR324 cluster bacterium]
AKPGQPLIIENILEDDRTMNWKNMPIDPGFRFYASLPLMSSRGFSIGTLCVFDSSPKNLGHQQVDGLRLLSDQIVHMLEKELNSTGGVSVPEDKTEEQPSQMKGQYYSITSILFADFVGFTNLVENSDPGELLETLNTFFSGFDRIISKHNVLKVKTVGDCYMCVGGIPSQQKTHAQEVCAAAIDMLKFVEGTNIQYEALGKPCWELRIGIHSGPVIAGSAGNTFDIWGDAVNIAARLESSGENGKIHISEKTKDYLEGSGSCTPRGEVELKNKGSWSTYFLDGLN